MDILRLLGLKLSAHVGTTKEERKRGALLEIDCELHFPFGPAAAKDDLKKTADYSAVYHLILKGATGAADGTGGSVSTDNVAYRGLITVAGSSPSYSVVEL